MTKKEFSYQFDILYNNSLSNKAPNLNEYEKSVFATKAEYEICKNYFNRKSNKLQEGFDDSGKRHVDFSNLISVSSSLKLPNDILAVLSETINERDTVTGEVYELTVIPLAYDDYIRKLSKPYPYPLKRQAWRVINGDNVNSIDIIGHEHSNNNLQLMTSTYRLRYVRMPKPIILYNAEDYKDENDQVLTIDGYPREVDSLSVYGPSSWEYPEIEVPTELQPEVLQRAIELAKIAWLGDLNATLAGGQRSE